MKQNHNGEDYIVKSKGLSRNTNEMVQAQGLQDYVL
jgi:hypothetical protein